MRPAADPRFWAILGLGLLVMALQLATPGLDSDQAVTGLMGAHILQGEFPVFFWRQDHGGVPESYLAAVSFFLFGVSRLALDVVPAAVAVALLLVTYRLAALLFGHGAGLLALFFMAVAPPYVVAHYVLARAYYVEHLLLGQLVLLLTARLAFLPLGPGARERALLVLGLVGGLGFYFGLQIVPALLTALLVLWMKDPRLPARRGAWLAAGGFLLGSLPFWIVNLARGFATFETAARFEGQWALGEALGLLWELSTVLLGVREYLGMPTFLPWPLALIAPALIIAALTTLLWQAVRDLTARGPAGVAGEGTTLLLIFVVLTLGVVLWGRFLQVPRYLLPLYPGLAICLARFCQLVGRRSALAGAVAVLAFGASTGVALGRTTTVLSPERRAEYWTRRAEEARLFRHLERAGLTRLYAFDYWLAPRLTFDARERIIVAQPFGDRYPRFTRLVDQAERPAYLVAAGDTMAQAGLKAAGIGFREDRIGGVVILRDFTPPAPVAPLLPQGWRLAGRPRGDASLAIDRDPLTHWTPGLPQQPGQRLEVALGSPVALEGVGFLAGVYEHDAPRGLAVELSGDGREWRRVADLQPLPRTFVWENEAPRAKPWGEFRVRFPRTDARALRLIQLGEDARFSWSVAELFLYSPGSSPPEIEPLREARILARRGEWRLAVRRAWEAAAVAPHRGEAYNLLAEGLHALRLPLEPPERLGEALERLGLYHLAGRAYRQALEGFPPGFLRSVPVEGLARSLEALGATAEARQWRARLAVLSPGSPPVTRFGRHLRLLNTQVVPDPVRAGATLTLDYHWEALSTPPELPTVFVHLVRAEDRLFNDHLLLRGLYPIGRWRRGERLWERYALPIPSTTPPGRYRIVVGVWFPETGERLRVWRGWLPTRRDRLVVGEVKILPGSSGTPARELEGGLRPPTDPPPLRSGPTPRPRLTRMRSLAPPRATPGAR